MSSSATSSFSASAAYTLDPFAMWPAPGRGLPRVLRPISPASTGDGTHKE